jgi:hypothetical protein
MSLVPNWWLSIKAVSAAWIVSENMFSGNQRPAIAQLPKPCDAMGSRHKETMRKQGTRKEEKRMIEK